MGNFAQTLKQALYEDTYIAKVLRAYKRLVNDLPQTADSFFINHVIDRMFSIFTNLLTDIEKHGDITWILTYGSNSDWYGEAVGIECEFYRHVGKHEYEHCTSLILNCYFESDHRVRYGRVVMFDEFRWLGKNDNLKEVQEVKKYLYIFRNVLFEIIKEIQPEMQFRKI